MKLILASQNHGKQAELRDLLGHLGLDLKVPQDFEVDIQVEETGSDYAENASLKARAFADAFGLWTLADDTGLEVEVLRGAPGLHSARLVGPGRSDADRRTHLLSLLESYARPWRARFVSVVALASPAGLIDLKQGVCPGEIIPGGRGELGFGYDPIFLLDGGNKTMAELPLEKKNQLSHRALAIQSMLPTLRVRLGLEPGSK